MNMTYLPVLGPPMDLLVTPPPTSLREIRNFGLRLGVRGSPLNSYKFVGFRCQKGLKFALLPRLRADFSAFLARRILQRNGKSEMI